MSMSYIPRKEFKNAPVKSNVQRKEFKGVSQTSLTTQTARKIPMKENKVDPNKWNIVTSSRQKRNAQKASAQKQNPRPNVSAWDRKSYPTQASQRSTYTAKSKVTEVKTAPSKKPNSMSAIAAAAISKHTISLSSTRRGWGTNLKPATSFRTIQADEEKKTREKVIPTVVSSQ